MSETDIIRKIPIFSDLEPEELKRSAIFIFRENIERPDNFLRR